MNYGYLRFMKELGSLVKKRSFAIIGNEAFFKEEAFHEVRKQLRKLHPMDEEDFDVSQKGVRIGDVEEALCTYPLIGKCRLVVVRNADKLKDLKRLAYWFNDPTLDTKAIFSFTDEMEKLPFEVDACCVANDMGPMSKEFEKYIDYCLEGTGKRPEPDARDYLKHQFANNIHLMKNELIKAACFVGNKETISVVDLQQTMASYPVAKVFDLVDLLVQRNLQQAILVLEDLLDQGTDGTFLIHLMTLRLQLLWGAARARQRGENLKEYFLRKKIPLFQFEKVLDGLRVLKEYHITRYFDMLCVYESRLRWRIGDSQHQRLVTEALVVDFCR